MGKEILAKIFKNSIHDVLENGSIILQIHKISNDWTKIENDWILLKDNKYKKYSFSHRIYSGYELKKIFEYAGFKNINLYGNFEAEKYNNNAQRLILTAEK